MHFYQIIKIISLIINLSFGLFAIIKNPKRMINQTFFLMILSTLVFEFGNLMAFIDTYKSMWLKVTLIGLCLLSANTFLFSLIYGRKNYREHLKLRMPYIVAMYSLSLTSIVLIIINIVIFEFGGEKSNYILFNRAGSVFLSFLFLCSLITLVNLENTYRQIKNFGRRLQYSVILFMGTIAFQLLFYSFAIGLSYINSDILFVTSITFILSNALIFFNIILPGSTSIYINRAIISKSYTMLLVGLYLLIIGTLSKIIQIIGKNLNFFFAFLSVFIILLAFIMVIVSRSLKERFQSFIERNFYKNKYDYRKEWENFSKRIFTIFNTEDLYQEILKTISNSIGSNTAVLFLLNENNREYFVAKSLESDENKNTESLSSDDPFLDWLWRYGTPVKIKKGVCMSKSSHTKPPEVPNIISKSLGQPLSDVNAICVPIITENNLIGFIVLGHMKDGSKLGDYSQEDIDLLETMATQISIAIMNAKRSYELSIARELESFNRFSAILLHDLKSSASMLSLVVQNAVENFNNPEFQKDAFSTINSVVNRIQKLIQKFSSIDSNRNNNIKNLQLMDLNEVVRNAISASGIQKVTRIKLVEEFNPLPKTVFDPEDIENVVINIILNAIESITDEGIITIRTSCDNQGYVQVSVSDTGCGMSQEFIKYNLFRPFQTTKTKGLGIGLYQCKSIIEFYNGFIDVQSQEGIGSTFSVNLPIKELVNG